MRGLGSSTSEKSFSRIGNRSVSGGSSIRNVYLRERGNRNEEVGKLIRMKKDT